MAGRLFSCTWGMVCVCVLAGVASAQPAVSENPWQETPRQKPAVLGAPAQAWVQPQICRTYQLDPARMQAQLAAAPSEGVKPGAGQLVLLPMPDGSYTRFEVVESPVMAPELAAQFPEIKTYLGYGLDDPAASARIDFTPLGFHAQILSPDGAVYVDPYWRGDITTYASYYKHDYQKDAKGWACLTQGADASGEGRPAMAPPAFIATGSALRTYRLACAATGEYTAYYGGTVSGAMAGIVTTVNRVVGIYERELAIRMVLIANNNLLVYTNASTDPYTNNDGGTMLGQNQTTIDSVIGSANYDIGHVFSTGGGGVAYLGCVCRSNKAGGVTGSPAPVGDAYDVDYVAHEMGHQFGANHSFNGAIANCSGGNRNASTAYEPGSGSTIMCYAGICGSDDLQPHSDPFFHSIGIEEITAYTTGSGYGLSCAVSTSTGNHAPTINAGPDYTIPQNTPFTLTASGSDSDGEAITYCWEERDLGPQAEVSAPDNGSIPLFRPWVPTTSPSRTFPRLQDLLNNTTAIGERLPTTNRTMRFRVTARDNRAGGGATNSDDALVTVTTAAGPFRVTSPNTAVTWSGARTVTWNVAGTNAAPVTTALVDILLSTDGGNTFPITLASGTPNDGSESVAMPSVNTTTARIKVQAVGNIYFDVSDVNFAITTAEYVAFADTGVRTINDAVYDGNANGHLDPGETAVHLTLQIQNNGNLTATGVTAALSSLTPGVSVVQGTSAYPDLAPGGSGANATDYVISLSPDVPCGSTVNLQLAVTSAQGGNTIDYAFVTGSGSAAPVTISYTGPAVTIPDNTRVNVPLTVGSVGIIDDVNFRFDGSSCSTTADSPTVGLSHTWVGDLIISLISPHGTQVILANRPGGNDNGGNNFCHTLFDDDGAFPSIQTIAASGAPYSGTYLPANSLSAFNGEDAAGTWTLRVDDMASGDTGAVRAFSLIITPRAPCAPPVAPADFNRDGYVDNSDFEHFAACVTRAGVAVIDPNCLNADLDPDGDVDQSDFGIFQRCISGSAVLANPRCAD